MKLSELFRNIEVLNIIGDGEIDITGVNIDSRRIRDGHLFVAIPGTQTDGHKFIPKAIEQGAVAVMCEYIPNVRTPGVTYIVVESTEDCVGEVATQFYGDPSRKLQLVGVTGTNGKTTIATLLYNMFRKFGHK
jgi:UDP-N-acetylmuramoyl-L-alanyl-D-glutamate--2,6-diaminopimelate ligase